MKTVMCYNLKSDIEIHKYVISDIISNLGHAKILL